ncbi:MAG: hypothetical protein OXI81_14840 [Paracoccaceae bacterium]|nr:hypothetical protein [Paracoccaceae bacterium]MDE2912234.1 hypothetical protein [Paracoccaceae bacterium]
MLLAPFVSAIDFEIPSGSDVLAKIGVQPASVREAIAEDRALRCSYWATVFPARRFANLAPALPLEPGLDADGHDGLRNPAPAHRPAGRKWRMA